jgi:hypothetical protein
MGVVATDRFAADFFAGTALAAIFFAVGFFVARGMGG